MGQYAEDIINGYCNSLGDYTAEYNVKYNRYTHYKLTLAERNINAVRKELATLIKYKIKSNPMTNQNVLVDQARHKINLKYGKGWRERGLCVNSDNQWKPLNESPL